MYHLTFSEAQENAGVAEECILWGNVPLKYLVQYMLSLPGKAAYY